ncbi:hypothetical protein TSOC_004681 [Tetrabaena socialis]|uniref:Haem-binding uptake Tiki superfamily ChaN domain-containing protein n=1 Tax=Tetrabaena socialis TaxID=47790 RepID=A0A2J8A897_9CHLO|nr:hypothetical protein TSOC_004681 [Tetrabaena socialis]|eukprot:PNH08738.1 hypothetical protein TSOC_004681 [Tetrabaena socialis]
MQPVPLAGGSRQLRRLSSWLVPAAAPLLEAASATRPPASADHPPPHSQQQLLRPPPLQHPPPQPQQQGPLRARGGRGPGAEFAQWLGLTPAAVTLAGVATVTAAAAAAAAAPTTEAAAGAGGGGAAWAPAQRATAPWLDVGFSQGSLPRLVSLSLQNQQPQSPTQPAGAGGDGSGGGDRGAAAATVGSRRRQDGRGTAAAPPPPPPPCEEGSAFAVYDRDGAPSSFSQLLASLASYDVVLLGEYHDDPVAHRLQLRLLQHVLLRAGGGGAEGSASEGGTVEVDDGRNAAAAPARGGGGGGGGAAGSPPPPPPPQLGRVEQGGAAAGAEAAAGAAVTAAAAAARPVALSLEMFERDAQVVMDEYLAGACTEADLLKDARPWPNYRGDYRPLVLWAKQVPKEDRYGYQTPLAATNIKNTFLSANTKWKRGCLGGSKLGKYGKYVTLRFGCDSHDDDVREDEAHNWFRFGVTGWDQAPLIARIVAASWVYHNAPEDFEVHLISRSDLPTLLPPDVIRIIDKVGSVQAQSVIIRLALLTHHGGVWADSTMLCMMPLASWVFDALQPTGFWMYRGRDYGAGPASGFIVSIRNSFLISAWYGRMLTFWQSTQSGKFHSEQRLGICEHLAALAPAARVCIVTFVPSGRGVSVAREVLERGRLHTYGDWLVLTDGQLPRSFGSEHPV